MVFILIWLGERGGTSPTPQNKCGGRSFNGIAFDFQTERPGFASQFVSKIPPHEYQNANTWMDNLNEQIVFCNLGVLCGI